MPGSFLLGDTDSVTTTGAFANSGNIQIDNQYGGQGGSTFAVGTGLTNAGTISVGTSGLSGNDAVRAASIVNRGTINLSGNIGASSLATLGSTGLDFEHRHHQRQTVPAPSPRPSATSKAPAAPRPCRAARR